MKAWGARGEVARGFFGTGGCNGAGGGCGGRMDSITQATLGAAVAHACWRRPLGRWALAWGAGLGTLPDLDIVVYPWLDEVQRLYWHRGESHAVWLMLPMAWLAGGLVRWVHGKPEGLSARRARVGVFLIFFTHVLIDVFTVYGTQVLAPVSRHGFQTGNLFIIDPLYTVPLLLGVLVAGAVRSGRVGWGANRLGLVLSTLYVGWSFGAQAGARGVFERELARQGIEVTRGLTTAGPFNTLLWRHVAEGEGGFWVGYWSWKDEDRRVRFEFLPQEAQRVAGWEGTREFEVVRWFSQGWWAVVGAGEDGGVRVADLRFGELRDGKEPEGWGYVFAWDFEKEGEEVRFGAARSDPGARGRAMSQVWPRMWGEREGW